MKVCLKDLVYIKLTYSVVQLCIEHRDDILHFTYNVLPHTLVASSVIWKEISVIEVY